jgi:hypothetical protein
MDTVSTSKYIVAWLRGVEVGASVRASLRELPRLPCFWRVPEISEDKDRPRARDCVCNIKLLQYSMDHCCLYLKTAAGD